MPFRPDRAKISHFQNLFRFIQYGCHSFNIDASSDTVPNQINGSISKSAVNLEKIGRGQIFGLSRDTPSSPGQIEQKLAIFKTCSDSFNMDVIRSVLMPVVTLPSFKMIGRLEVGHLETW